MNTPNPLIPQGSLQGKTHSKANFRMAVFTILAIHVVLLGGLLFLGCQKKEEQLSTAKKTNETEFPPLAKTNEYYPTNPVPETNPPAVAMVTNPPVVEAPALTTVPTPAVSLNEYTIVKNDTFARIAKAKGVTIKAIADANPGVSSSKLKVGQKIQLPATAASSSLPPARANGGTSEVATSTYVVKPGDNLTKIASKHGTSVKALRAANNLKTDQVKVGQKLKLPATKTAAAKAVTPGLNSSPASGLANP